MMIFYVNYKGIFCDICDPFLFRHYLRVNYVNLYIEIFFIESKATEFTDVHDPATNKLLCRTPKCTKDEMESAVQSARNAYEKWRNTSVLTRQTLMLKYQELIREHSVSICLKYILNSEVSKIRNI